LFGGDVTVEVNTTVTAAGAITGRIFGSGLTSCAGLTAWPIFGSSFKNVTGATEFAFRAMTVDSATCGAVDYIVPLSGKPLSGTAQLHNDRTNFGNTTTMTLAPCASPLPAVVGPGGGSDAGADVQGNQAH
jgi:hypothetical protein